MTYITRAMAILREELANAGKPNQETAFEHGYLLLAFMAAADVKVSLADIHNVWAIIRQVNRPGHPDLVPFDQLSDDIVAYDEPFLDAVENAGIRIAREL